MTSQTYPETVKICVYRASGELEYTVTARALIQRELDGRIDNLVYYWQTVEYKSVSWVNIRKDEKFNDGLPYVWLSDVRSFPNLEGLIERNKYANPETLTSPLETARKRIKQWFEAEQHAAEKRATEEREKRNLEITRFNWQGVKKPYRKGPVKRKMETGLDESTQGYTLGGVCIHKVLKKVCRASESPHWYQIDAYGWRVGYVDSLADARIIGQALNMCLASNGFGPSLWNTNEVPKDFVEKVMLIAEPAKKMGRLTF
jgi:hypothetical protein